MLADGTQDTVKESMQVNYKLKQGCKVIVLEL